MAATTETNLQAVALLEPPVAKKNDKPEDKPKRSRARDTGEVVALGVEIDADLHQAFEECRDAKKWSKRTLVEEALKLFLGREGYLPAQGKKGGAK